MEGEKTHWRKVDNPNYIGAYSMPGDGSDVILTIKEVKMEDVVGDGGAKKKTRVCYFKEPSKPMILNATNSRMITSLYKTGIVEEWEGKQIQIFVDWIQDRITKMQIQCLRVRPLIPKTEKPTLIKDTPQFNQALEYMKKEGSKIEAIEKKFTLSKEVKEALCTN